MQRHDFKACSDVNLRVGEFERAYGVGILFFFMFLKLPSQLLSTIRTQVQD